MTPDQDDVELPTDAIFPGLMTTIVSSGGGAEDRLENPGPMNCRIDDIDFPRCADLRCACVNLPLIFALYCWVAIAGH
jgi:hypothetical protein